jgi:hypothetical protein
MYFVEISALNENLEVLVYILKTEGYTSEKCKKINGYIQCYFSKENRFCNTVT